MLCPRRHRLLVDYRETVDTYAQCVRAMVDKSCGALGSDLDLLRRACREALAQAEQARLVLHRHEADHLCDRMDFAAKQR